MAGDWIKLEHTTPDKPEVVRMADILSIDQDAVVGKLVRIWIWADQNSIDGNALTVTDAFLDRVTASSGFAAALREVGWLSGRHGLLTIPNFDLHNGQTAKARAVTNRRVARHRDKSECNAPSVTGVTPPSLQKPLPEKRREESELASLAPSAGGREESRTLPSSLDTAAFRETWGRWLQHWGESFANGRPMPNATADAQLRKLAEIGSARAIAAIENSIAKGNFREPAEPFAQAGRPSGQSDDRKEGVWQLEKRIEAVRERMRDLHEGRKGMKYVGIKPGKTTPYEWTDEGKREYDELQANLDELRRRLALAPKESAA